MEALFQSSMGCDASNDSNDTTEEVALFVVQCLDGLDWLDELNLKDDDNSDLLIGIVLAIDFLRNAATTCDDISVRRFWALFCAMALTKRTSAHRLVTCMNDTFGESRIDQLSWTHLCVCLVQVVAVLYDLTDYMKRHVMNLDTWRSECVERLLAMLDDRIDFAALSPAPLVSSMTERLSPPTNEVFQTEEKILPKPNRRVVPICSLASLTSPLTVAVPPGRTEGKRRTPSSSSATTDANGANSFTVKKQPCQSSKKMRKMSHHTEQILADMSRFLDGTDSETKEELVVNDTGILPTDGTSSSSGVFYFSSSVVGRSHARNSVSAVAEGTERRLYRRKFASTHL